MIQSRFNNDFDYLFRESMPKEIAIAVSGGVDSLALLYLVSIWAKRSNIKISIFTVNHNLRIEAVEETDYVQSIAKKLGHDFFALSWHCGDSKVALQERARKGRYDLMSAKCHELGIQTLLAAHHLDDMLETYMMRKNKKSGKLGLSSANSFFHNDIRILRPLFNFTKAELITYLQSKNVEWREDASNESDLYERNRMRKQIALFSNEDKDKLQHEMQAVNKQALALNQQLLVVMAESLQINNYGFACINLPRLKIADSDIQIQILNYILTIISGKSAVPRFRNVEKLWAKLNSGEEIKCSLHSCVLKEQNDKLYIFREKTAIDKNQLKLKSLQNWDNRFDISLSNVPTGSFIGRLSFDEYLAIKDQIDLSSLAKISDNNHKLILFTLPIIKNLEKVVAIPHISYYDEFDRKAIKKIVFRPNFVSRFTHFL